MFVVEMFWCKVLVRDILCLMTWSWWGGSGNLNFASHCSVDCRERLLVIGEGMVFFMVCVEFRVEMGKGHGKDGCWQR